MSVFAPRGRGLSFQRGDELGQHVAGLQDQIQIRAVELELTVAGIIEQSLGIVRELHDRCEVHKPRHPLDGVERAEHRVDQFDVLDILLQIE